LRLFDYLLDILSYYLYVLLLNTNGTAYVLVDLDYYTFYCAELSSINCLYLSDGLFIL